MDRVEEILSDILVENEESRDTTIEIQGTLEEYEGLLQENLQGYMNDIRTIEDAILALLIQKKNIGYTEYITENTAVEITGRRKSKFLRRHKYTLEFKVKERDPYEGIYFEQYSIEFILENQPKPIICINLNRFYKFAPIPIINAQSSHEFVSHFINGFLSELKRDGESIYTLLPSILNKIPSFVESLYRKYHVENKSFLDDTNDDIRDLSSLK